MRILFSLFLLSIWGCSPSILEKDELIYLSVDTLYCGNKFDIYFNANHKDNKLDLNEENDANIAFVHNGIVKFYNVKLNKVKEKIYKASFQVPDSASLLYVSLGPSKFLSSNTCSEYFPIYDNTKKLTKEAINFLLSISRSQEEYENLIKLDTSYYFDDYSREYILARLQSRKGLAKEEIVQSTLMLENLLRKDYQSNYKVRINLLLNIHNMNVLVGNYDRAIDYLDSLIYYIKSKPIKQSDIDNNIEYLNEFSFFSANSVFMSRPTKEQFQEIKEKYIELAILANNHLSEVKLHNRFSILNYFKKVDSLNTKFTYHIFKNIIKNTNEGRYYYYFMHNGVFIDIFDYLFLIKDYDNAKKMLELSNENFEKYEKWKYSKDLNDYTSIFLVDRDYNIHNINYIKLYIATGKIAEAKSIAFKFYNIFSDYDYWKASVASGLIDIYLKENKLDSAEYYLSEMFLFKGENRLTNLEKINNYRKANSLEVLSETAFREKYSIKDVEFQTFRHFNLNIDGKNINTSAFGDTLTVLLNVNDECPACNSEAPSIKNYLKPYINKKQCKLIYVSDSPKEKLYKEFGSDIIISKRTADMRKAFSMKEKPSNAEWTYVYILKGQKYLASRNYFKEMNWVKKYF